MQIKEGKGRDSDQIFSVFRIVKAKVIGSFINHDDSRSLSTQLYDGRIIGNGCALPILVYVLHFYEHTPVQELVGTTSVIDQDNVRAKKVF